MSRIHSIDYLRGIMALAVMIYHFFSWSLGVPDSDSFMGRLGIYAVSTFYIISGISLYLVYRGTKWSFRETGSYVLKRYFRIAPAFWLATFLMIIFVTLYRGAFSPDWERYASNLSLTFGFYSPRDYIPAGGWSIGNEMVFYAFFPLLIMATKRTLFFLVSMFLTLSLYLWFAFYVLSPQETLANQWELYINPMNQAFLFSVGVFIGWCRDRYKTPSQRVLVAVFMLSVAMFSLYPAEGNKVVIVTGVERICFTLFCGALCFSVLNINFNVRGYISRALKFFGDISYSLYLLHAVAAKYVLHLILPKIGGFSSNDKALVLFIVVLPISILISYLCYRFIEKPVIRVGKSITTNLQPAASTGRL